jgi:trigger factor
MKTWPSGNTKSLIMPTVTRESIGLLNEKITVTVNKEDYLPSFEKAIRQYAKSANIPGFRKGMVPPGVIKKMHGPAVFTEEVLRSVEKGLTDYLRQEQLDIFAQPLPALDSQTGDINVQEPRDYSFAFEIGLKPGFEIPDLKSASIRRYKVDVTNEMIEDEINRLRQRFGKMTEPDSAETEEHVLNVSFVPLDEEGNPLADTKPKENSLLLKYFSEPLRKTLTGAKKDDTLVITLQEAFDEKEREWMISDLGVDSNDPATLTRPYRMTVVKVGHVEKRNLDPDFFKEVYPAKDIDTEEAFRAEVRSEIEHYWEKQSINHLHHELFHILSEQTKMEFPENFLRRWMLSGGEKPKTADEVEAEFPTFRNQLRWTLVSDRIVHDQQLHVSRDEIRNSMKEQVMGYFGSMNMAGNLDWLDNYIERMMQDEQQLESTYRKLITEKVFQWAESQVSPVDEKISVEAFLALQKEHAHEH